MARKLRHRTRPRRRSRSRRLPSNPRRDPPRFRDLAHRVPHQGAGARCDTQRPEIDVCSLAPAFGGVVADLVDQVILRHEQNKPLDTGILLLLDETANVPLVQLPHWASTIAGYNVQLVTVWQSKGQIDEAYGNSADTVIGNHRTTVLFPGISDLATIRYVSELLGNEHQPGYVNAGVSFGDLGNSGRDSAAGVPLVPANVLRELADNDRLVITGNTPPIHAKALTAVPRRWQHHTRPIES